MPVSIARARGGNRSHSHTLARRSALMPPTIIRVICRSSLQASQRFTRPVGLSWRALPHELQWRPQRQDIFCNSSKLAVSIVLQSSHISAIVTYLSLSPPRDGEEC